MLGDKDVCVVVAVKDINVAKSFYEEKLGLKKVEDGEDGVMFKSGNSGIFVYPSQYAGTNQATAATWMVDDVPGFVEQLKGKGVTFEQYDNLPGVTREGDVHVMGNMKAAWFKDPDGNILNIVSK